MAVTINNIPKLAFTQNEVKVQLTSDNYLESEGDKGVYRLSFIAPGPTYANAAYFILRNKKILYGNLMGTGSSFNGYYMPYYSSDQTVSEYMTRVANALVQGVELNESFKITVDDDEIVLTAKDFGADYALVIESNTFGLNQVVAPSDRMEQVGFKHYIQLWKADLSEQIFETNIPLDYPITGVSTIDISGILHSLVSLDVPNLTDFFQRCPNSLISYVVKYANRYGKDQGIKELTDTEPLFAVLGGYSMMALLHIKSTDHLQKYLMASPSLYELQNWFESYPVEDIEVKTNQPHFLYFVNSRDEGELINLRVVATLQDGSYLTSVLEGGSVASFEKVCFNVGYLALWLDSLGTDGNRVQSYQVNLIGSDNEPRTVAKHFYVDRKYEANTRYFLFAGSDGNFKTLRTYGISEGTSEFEPVTGTLIATQSERIKQGDVLTLDVLNYDTEEVNSGYIIGSQKQLALKELLLSTAVYRVIGEMLVPVQITSKTIELPKEKTGASAVKIAYRVAWNDKLFTGDTWALNVPPINKSQEALNDI